MNYNPEESAHYYQPGGVTPVLTFHQAWPDSHTEAETTCGCAIRNGVGCDPIQEFHVTQKTYGYTTPWPMNE